MIPPGTQSSSCLSPRCAFCAALTNAHPQLAAAQRLLQQLSGNERWALLHFRPALQRPACGCLAAIVASLPPGLQKYAIRMHCAADGEGND